MPAVSVPSGSNESLFKILHELPEPKMVMCRIFGAKNILDINKKIKILKDKNRGKIKINKYGTYFDYRQNIKLKFEKSQQQYIEKIVNSNIDFSKFGWVNQASKIINQKPQRVNQWMKRFMSDFYNDNCFKRKLPD